MKYLEQFHKKITEYRERHELSQEDIAQICGVDQQVVALWEADQSTQRAYPNLAQLLDLCVALKEDLESFLDNTDIDSGQLELPGLRFIEEGDLSQSLDALNSEIDKLIPSEQELELLRRFRKSDDENKKLIIQLMTN